jgi:hypothetical protein
LGSLKTKESWVECLSPDICNVHPWSSSIIIPRSFVLLSWEIYEFTIFILIGVDCDYVYEFVLDWWTLVLFLKHLPPIHRCHKS